jgi:hypothetical protein
MARNFAASMGGVPVGISGDGIIPRPLGKRATLSRSRRCPGPSRKGASGRIPHNFTDFVPAYRMINRRKLFAAVQESGK